MRHQQYVGIICSLEPSRNFISLMIDQCISYCTVGAIEGQRRSNWGRCNRM